jgi:NAD-dependent dihydropyrimidine dehydrogenase PreA subunit
LICLGALVVTALIFWIVGERERLLRKSTWQMMRMQGLKRILNFKAIHGYIYGRWPSRYIHTLIYHILPRLKPGGKKWLADRYHGKVLTPELAEALITHNHDIPHQDLEQIIPYPLARDIVLKGPPDIAVFECPCRHSRENPCQPSQVCMVIGQPFVNFVLQHHPETSRKLTQTEAVKLLKEEYERGHLHSAWFKDVLGDRFYEICNCCKCCCGGIEAMTKHGVPMMASSGYIARVDETVCAACETCKDICPFDAVKVNDTAEIIWDDCMGCGVCEGQCTTGAMALVRDEKKGVPLDVRLLD